MASTLPLTQPAAQRVLGTVELLEQILLSIGQTKPFRSVADQQRTSAELRALLVSQRVNTIWRDLIKRNADIQRKLCFAPPLPDSATKSLHMRWNNIIWLPEKGLEGIDILGEIFNQTGVPSSRRKMLAAPWAKERIDATVTVHRFPHRYTYREIYRQPVTMERLLHDLKTKFARFDEKQVKQARLTIRQGMSQNGDEAVILDAYFDSAFVKGYCDEHWTESQCKICAWECSLP